VGEMVLVDRELVRVEAIGSSSLTVTRGPVNPAAAHAAGARIAAVVSAWPGSVTFDVSTGCPKADVGNGPETWNEWNIRRGRAVLDAADWDGLLIDCLDSSPSWMVSDGSVRSIDPARSNKAVTDGYVGFNSAWNTGAVAYGTGLRAASGDRLLIGNGNMRNYAMNGNIFEDFPRADLAPSTWNLVFMGPWAYPHASYADWATKSAGQNLTLVQTYGAANDYKLMRFGLTSALMNDGYFQMSGSAHSASGLYWFDEYDNAGAGRGYLGQPTGVATKVGNAYRRDYANGIALVNPTASAVTVSLGGAFAKIDGVQDRTVNDGALVDSVTLAPRDGVVLLRVIVLGLQASSTAVPYGLETTLQVTATAAPSAEIVIEHRAAGETAWKAAAIKTADSHGLAALTHKPLVTTEYRARTEGGSAISRTVSVGVRPRLSIHASKKRVSRGGTVVFRGSITHPGRSLVRLQRLVGGSWKTVKRVRTSSSRWYKTTVTPGTRGTFRYRVRVSADASHLTATSGTAKIVVR